MANGNRDLVREATMARVREHVRGAVGAGQRTAELTAEVVRTYGLNRVEAGLADIMVRYYASLAKTGPRDSALDVEAVQPDVAAERWGRPG